MVQFIDEMNPYSVYKSDLFSLQFGESCCSLPLQISDGNNGSTCFDVYFLYLDNLSHSYVNINATQQADVTSPADFTSSALSSSCAVFIELESSDEWINIMFVTLYIVIIICCIGCSYIYWHRNIKIKKERESLKLERKANNQHRMNMDMNLQQQQKGDSHSNDINVNPQKIELQMAFRPLPTEIEMPDTDQKSKNKMGEDFYDSDSSTFMCDGNTKTDCESQNINVNLEIPVIESPQI